MTIEKELKDLVEVFTPFDVKERRYTAQLDKPKLLLLDRRFTKCINDHLLSEGPTLKSLEKNYRKLTLNFHPDKTPHYSPEITWLEQQLSSGLNNGTCFKTLSFCYEKLTQPTKFKEIEFSGINSIEDCKKWLEHFKAQSNTYSTKSLCDSLIALLDASSEFFDSTGTIKPNALKNLVQFIPAIIAGFGTTLFMEELFVVYAIYFVLLKGGQKLGRSDYRELKEVGHLLQEYTTITAMSTTTLLVRILELIFWTSRQCYTVSLQIGSSILAPLLTATPAPDKAEVDAAELCKELVLAGEKIQPGIQFDNPELKIIAAPFEKYLAINAQQFFGAIRIGKAKRDKVEALLFNLRVLDKLDWSLEDKYLDILNELEKIKKDKDVYTDKTKEAVNYAEEVITILRSPSITELITYEPDDETEVAQLSF